MTQWQGKSKGTLLGYRIFVFCIKKLGIRTAYSVLVFVAFYYLITAWKSNRSLYYYLHNRQGYSVLKTWGMMYMSYFRFGQVLIDKTAISLGLRNRFTYEFDGIEILKQLLEEKKGAILISAHVGNFEVAEYFFADIDFDCQINLVTTDREHSFIKEYFESISIKTNLNFIIVKDDMSHIFEISNCLSNNEIICFTGDRYFPGTKILTEEFLGEQAVFPAGPFSIASRMKVPVAYVYVMKESNLHYHLYTRRAEVKHRDAQHLLRSYCDSVTRIVKKYPLQWFNYYDFWDSDSK
ncbi:lipid A biosynthesis acyltransferase [Myroides marinus]|uniref:LpxL/LpxP family acyltransferase n=1 Tax=Myroides marinus TaxID=703342 RepID=UPI002574FEC7|nr:lipid A biosynthesis acyltransferase [Myroides marinus]MDM1367495.1 lipid A biosynthesis acyltransferase [Myroides marinus]MDM1370913.1 lipid A biosynthesis acyltransferase [Myroides marinus]MDM1373994.1 lipid A biosynthesis acyltransferase [Myroides marinus]MDM1383016.1 lipid A biosynthesis acyltransferase [Myroides marinus]MDM1388467.1 lipid A biosynthesis acyltransferase [Myroides marinus]